MPRNRQHTEARIREAATQLLAREGFTAWGINAIARAADCDKVLIYRYYGSLEGLLKGVVDSVTFWPDPGTLPASSGENFLSATHQHLSASPVISALLGHPLARHAGSVIERAFRIQLEIWKKGFAARCSGGASEDIHQLAAGTLLMAALGNQPDPSRVIWQQFSPPLTWQPEEPSPPIKHWNNDPLPTELL